MTLINLSTPVVLSSPSTRTISGRIVTWGETGDTSAGPVRFAAGSIHAPADVVLMNEHDTVSPLGRAVTLSSTSEGMDAVFKIAETTRGNDALVEAADGLRSGLSVGVDVIDYTTERDGSWTVTAASLDHVGLVTRPAMASARVSQVAASETEPIPDPDPAPVEPEAEPAEETTVADDAASPPVAEVTAAHIPTVKVQDGFPYGPGSGLSFYRDMYNARHDVEAAQRVHRAQSMLVAAQDSTDIATIIPPGYRPDLYEGELTYPTPITSSFRRMAISNATPFTIPTFTSATGMSGDHVEGTNPDDGILAFGEVTVTPKAVSGKWTGSREMLDAANPNLDAIVRSAMMEEYARDLEQYVQSVIAAGATAGAGIAEATATNDLIAELIAFDDTRYAAADVVLVSPTLFGVLALEEDESGRKMNPYLGPVNASGQVGSGAQTLSVVGQPVVKAWAHQTGALIARSSDATVFTSGVQSWRFEEVAGPANIVFAQFGYVGCAVTRAAGVVDSDYTPTAP